MLIQILGLLLLFTITNFASISASSRIQRPPPFNISHFLFPKVTAFTEPTSPLQPPHFLQDVLDGIANKEKWVLEDIRVLELDVRKAKYGTVQRYEFRVKVGKSEIVLKMHEEAKEWKHMAALRKNGSSDFETLVRKIGPTSVIDSFKIEGPFQLRAAGNDDLLTLMLPLNTSYSGLRRISVGEGITVEVKGAEEISMSHPSDSQQPLYGISSDICTALLPIRVKGSASIVAYRSKRPAAYIATVLSTKKGIKLLSDKCFVRSNYKKKPRHIFSSTAFLARILRTFLTDKADDPSLGSVKSIISSSTVFRFKLELERYIRSNDTYWSTLAEWRTRPIFERVWFEVAARLEGEILKPLVIKKFRPFIEGDSLAWSSLLSNLSFTKFPSMLVPPEPLTLDVKW